MTNTDTTSINHSSSGLPQMKTILNHLFVEIDLEKTKILLLGLLFVGMGFMSVVTQVMLADIIKWAGFELVSPPQSSLVGVLNDFWGDAVMIALILAIYGMSTYSGELEVGKPIYFNLARPISRETYFLTRFAVRAIGVMGMYILASLITYCYSLVFFDGFPIDRVIVATCLVAFGPTTVLALVMMASSRLSTVLSAIVGVIFVVVQFLVGMVPPLKWFSPLTLMNEWTNVLSGEISFLDLFLTYSTLTLWIIVPCIVGLVLYKQRDL